MFACKAYVLVPGITKFIRGIDVTPVNVHDSQIAGKLFANVSGIDYALADVAYVGNNLWKGINARTPVIEKVCRNHQLDNLQKQTKHLIARVRRRVAHVFGFTCQTMRGRDNHCVGMKRVRELCFFCRP